MAGGGLDFVVVRGVLDLAGAVELVQGCWGVELLVVLVGGVAASMRSWTRLHGIRWVRALWCLLTIRWF